MITRKALLNKLEEMNRADVLVKVADYRNTHPMQKTPLEKAMIQLLGVNAVAARTHTTKRGDIRQSPAWLIAAHKTLAGLIYQGHDINVRALIAILHQ